ncbi:hypothetical protein ACP70R_030155 [Stipagrostis hirtigluma subsp. patula]
MASVRRNDTWDNRLRPLPNRSTTAPKRVSPRRAVTTDTDVMAGALTKENNSTTVATSGPETKDVFTCGEFLGVMNINGSTDSLADGVSRTQATGTSRVYYSGPRVLDLNSPAPGEDSSQINPEQCQEMMLPHVSTELSKDKASSSEENSLRQNREVADKTGGASHDGDMPQQAGVCSKRKKDKLPRCLLRLY